MPVGDRIKRTRIFRRMTMKELGMAVGFSEASADVRIAQYESNTRVPKDDLLKKIASALNVNPLSLKRPRRYDVESIMYDLFELEEYYPNLRIVEVEDESDPEATGKHFAISFGDKRLDAYLDELKLHQEQLANGEITKEEYLEWKYQWSPTSDD